MKIFSDHFEAMSAADIVNTIREDGIFACERAITGEAIDAIFEEIGGLDFRINNNGISPVVHNTQTFLNQFLAVSRTAFSLVTHDRIVSILEEAFGPTFRIVGKRIYETRHGNYMSFHSDVGSPCTDTRQLDGLGLIFYMTDVEEGPFEVVENSQEWGASHLGSREEDERLLESQKIRTFKMPRGSYVIYNGRLLHRARPIETPGVARTSFHFQVNKGKAVGEPVLVNIGWLEGLSEGAQTLLGYGVPNSVPTDWPRSSPQNLPKNNDKVREYVRQNLRHLIAD